tara:strand:- start:350 stop:526 length:177 start_codon:yes stop_codon:yes gene_type:complete
MEKNKLYNSDKINTLEMQFGNVARSLKKRYEYPNRIDKRTKKYGNQRHHNGVMGKYNG